MKKISNNFGIYLESLRKSRNIPREDFIEDIMSVRQYQRHIKGETNISSNKIFLLVDKLGLDFFEVYNSFMEKDENEFLQIQNIYYQIVNLDYKKASVLIKEFGDTYVSSSYNHSFLEYCKITVNRYLKIISENMTLNQLKELIDYPNCLDLKIINFVELISLIEISDLLLKNENNNSALNFIYDMLADKKLISGINIEGKLPSLIATTCKSLGMLGNHEKVLELSQRGIDICFTNQILNSLVQLLYYNSLALLNLNRRNEALDVAKRVFMLLEIENHQAKIERFALIFKKHFNISYHDLFKK